MDNYNLNPKRTPDAARRAAYGAARQMLDAGALCDDCKDLHQNRKAVAFVVHDGVLLDIADFVVSFLCQFYADKFTAERRKHGC